MPTEDAARPPASQGIVRVLFLCYGNACRSQMAEAYARALAGGRLEARSAGVSPVGFVPAEVGTVMAEEGISIDGQYSKSLHELGGEPFDLIVDLAGVLAEKAGGIPVRSRPVVDPFGGDLDDYRRTRTAVRAEIEALLADLKSSSEEEAGPGAAGADPAEEPRTTPE